MSMVINLEWIMVGAVSLGLICFVLGAISLTLLLQANYRESLLKKTIPKDKRGRRKNRKKRLKQKEIKRINLRRGVILGIMGLSLSGLAGYINYYQATNMSKSDVENITTGYYILDQMAQQLKEVEAETKSDEKMNDNIHTLSIRMASFSSKRASDQGTKESQLLLNRYYAKMGQLGINLSAQRVTHLREENLLESYQSDVERVKESQKKVLDFYRIDEKSLLASK